MVRMSSERSIEPVSEGDREAVERLLRGHGLPLDGLFEDAGVFLVVRVGGEVAGTAAVEVYGRSGLLRSVGVDARFQGSGVGRALVDEALRRARAAGVADVYLLTTGAADYFARRGFRPIDRTDVPAEVLASREFGLTVCSSARVMHRAL